MEQASSEMIGNLSVMDGDSFEKEWSVIGAGGCGGCGQVFKARHLQQGKDVAVKILCIDGGLCVKEDLVCEAELMLRAESPYVVKVLGVFRGHTPSSPGIISLGLVMDLMESGSLCSLQKKRECQPLPWPLVFRLVHQVAVGMNYLHSLTPTALIHMDLKPDNILLDADLNVKITDFGIAKFVDSVPVSRIRGWSTPFFTPPEALQGGATCAYDVYSFAILVWTILNPGYSDAPFDVSKGVRPSLEDVKRMEAPGLEELVELMERCWNQDPDQRPTFAECTAVTEGLYEKNKHWIDYYVNQVQLEMDAVILKCPKRDFHRLTLDTNKIPRFLSLSENNRKMTRVQHSDSDCHPRSFDYWEPVECTESLTGRCYWEVEWSGRVKIAVNHVHLCCYDHGSYRVQHMHYRKKDSLPVRHSRGSNRVAVYLDCPAGTLSFFEVSSADTLTHLYTYTFQDTVIEPFYAWFVVDFDSSVCLCEDRQAVRTDRQAVRTDRQVSEQTVSDAARRSLFADFCRPY